MQVKVSEILRLKIIHVLHFKKSKTKKDTNR